MIHKHLSTEALEIYHKTKIDFGTPYDGYKNPDATFQKWTEHGKDFKWIYQGDVNKYSIGDGKGISIRTGKTISIGYEKESSDHGSNMSID